jgi:nitroimidazol reductase NimA-like FMN-containing flavoprotein (pyridoxamine 5'-phosphate oxidase superfamily)
MEKNGMTNFANKANEVKFTKSEEKFLLENEACRIATSHNDIPHIAPVTYVYIDGFFFIATDYNTRKYNNIKANRKIAISVDIYGSSIENQAVIIQGDVEIIERGQEFKRLYKIFNDKFEWVRKDPWKEGEAPFLKIKPLKKVTWGI